ncbi:hypothetical protein BS47DRAFT_1336505 [Hydnum rufescens UP504]|uniref:Uncharacterized protein n=1 Tax=Hydnum rufescens UP504 TaxID=1448309 RepID=A0A9P6B9L3_9AGAM|nr:hypothetical protein BS47DRAFT_1336505 [Hydnum rufescens UP504]
MKEGITMSTFTGALLFSSMLNMCLNGMFLVQLSNFCGTFLRTEPAFIRVMVFMVSIFDISHTAVMAYAALYACFGSHKSRIFVWLYSTIRLWSIPIYVAAYGLLIQKLTHWWAISVLVICLLFVQTGGAIVWTIGTVEARTPVDLVIGNATTMAGTVICTMGAMLCSLCIVISVIITVRNSPVRVVPPRRSLLRHLQIVSVSTPPKGLQLVMPDAFGLPKSHVSMVIAIIVGKVWSNTLIHSLNSREALRHAPSMATLDRAIEFALQGRQRNSSMRDDFTLELDGDRNLDISPIGRRIQSSTDILLTMAGSIYHQCNHRKMG